MNANEDRAGDHWLMLRDGDVAALEGVDPDLQDYRDRLLPIPRNRVKLCVGIETASLPGEDLNLSYAHANFKGHRLNQQPRQEA